MTQVGLAVYLTLATLLSPWLCCCSAAPAAAPATHRADLSATTKHHGCRCQRPEVGSAGVTSPQQQNAPCEGHPCPVKQYLAQPAVVAAGPQLATLADAPLEIWQLLDVRSGTSKHAPLSRLGAVREIGREPTAFPFLTGRGVLRMLCVMRY